MAIWCIHVAGCMPKATNTHSEYVILIFHGISYYANALQFFATYVACRGRLLSPRTLLILPKRSDVARNSGVSVSLPILLLP